MTDPTAGVDQPTPGARCPWCSADLPDPDAKTCPSCEANLSAEVEAAVPGLTAIDLERLAFRRSTAPKKSRLMSWISGDSDYEDATDPVAPPGSLDLPPFEVRREMLRLEMAARIADLTAEAGALAADEADAKGADPVAAAAAIQAEIDAASVAQALELEAGLETEPEPAATAAGDEPIDPSGPAVVEAAATAGDGVPEPAAGDPEAASS